MKFPKYKNFITKAQDKNYFIKGSYFEIYNDQIYDLLTNPDLSDPLLIAEDAQVIIFIQAERVFCKRSQRRSPYIS